jgi:hypothetical protein
MEKSTPFPYSRPKCQTMPILGRFGFLYKYAQSDTI